MIGIFKKMSQRRESRPDVKFVLAVGIGKDTICILSFFFDISYFNLMFMAGAPVGDVSVHRPRVFYAGSPAANVKVRASDP